MKYRIIGAVACICILLVSVLNYPVLLTGRMESRRYHQHREATPKAVYAVHAEKEFCTHLPLIVIDTGGAEIPGRGLIPFSLAQSATKRSSLPMETASPFIPRTHLPSH